MVEAVTELEALDLGALRLACAVGDQCQLHAGRAQRVDRGVGIGIEPVLVAPHFGEGVGDAIGQRVVVPAKPGEAATDGKPSGAGNVEAPFGRLRPVGPEGPRLLHHGQAHALDCRSVMRIEMGREYVEQARPRLLGLGVGADQGVVEIEQDGAWQGRHVD